MDERERESMKEVLKKEGRRSSENERVRVT